MIIPIALTEWPNRKSLDQDESSLYAVPIAFGSLLSSSELPLASKTSRIYTTLCIAPHTLASSTHGAFHRRLMPDSLSLHF